MTIFWCSKRKAAHPGECTDECESAAKPPLIKGSDLKLDPNPKTWVYKLPPGALGVTPVAPTAPTVTNGSPQPHYRQVTDVDLFLEVLKRSSWLAEKVMKGAILTVQTNDAPGQISFMAGIGPTAHWWRAIDPIVVAMATAFIASLTSTPPPASSP